MTLEHPSHPLGLCKETDLYIERPADADLLRTLQAGESAYIRAARQAGKTTLLRRSQNQLAAQGYRCIRLDMGVFSYEGDLEQWYRSIAREIALGLGLRSVCGERILGEQGGRPIREQFARFLQDALRRTTAPVVLFLDEADSFLQMPGSTLGGFLAALRASSSNRKSSSRYHRFGFCLAGTCSFADLLRGKPRPSFSRLREIALEALH